MTDTQKLTKREFDWAVSKFKDERPNGTQLELEELVRGGPRDYFKMQQRFKLTGLSLLGLKLEVRGTVTMNADATSIGATGCLRARGEATEAGLQRPDLWGEFDLYEGKWTLRWL